MDSFIIYLENILSRLYQLKKELLIGDPSKAREKLGWKPKVKMEELAKIMIKADEEEVLKTYPSEKLAACQELGENLAEDSKLNLKSL